MMRRMKSRLSGTVAIAGLLAWPGCGSSGSSSSAAIGDGGTRDAATLEDGGGLSSEAGRTLDGGTVDGSTLDGGTLDGGTLLDGGSEDGASAGDGAFPKGEPITASPDQWTWVPFANAACADGLATGLGIYLSSASSKVLVYFEGGGACWNAETCYTLMTAANTTGYGPTEFQAESTDTSYLAMPGGFFDPTATANPFKDYSYVYLPYCTGDIFAGDNVATLGSNTAHFVGYENVTAYLSRIVPTFPAATRVVLAGSSAGGLGALWNWYQTQQAFGPVRVDLLDDSGTFMPSDIVPQNMGNSAAWTSAWNLASTSPPCAACGMDPSALYGYYAQLFPSHRGALLSYTMDTVLPSFYGITTSQFTTGLGEDITNEFTPNANLGAFLDSTSGHALFFDPAAMAGSVTLQTWITQMVTDDAAWATQGP